MLYDLLVLQEAKKAKKKKKIKLGFTGSNIPPAYSYFRLFCWHCRKAQELRTCHLQQQLTCAELSHQAQLENSQHWKQTSLTYCMQQHASSTVLSHCITNKSAWTEALLKTVLQWQLKEPHCSKAYIHLLRFLFHRSPSSIPFKSRNGFEVDTPETLCLSLYRLLVKEMKKGQKRKLKLLLPYKFLENLEAWQKVAELLIQQLQFRSCTQTSRNLV